MRYALADILRSPVTGRRLHLQAFDVRKRENSRGWDYCKAYCARLDRGIVGEEPCNICGYDEVVSGMLSSENQEEVYPIINGIPRLLPPEFMKQIRDRYPAWFEKYKIMSAVSDHTVLSEQLNVQKKTAKHFGREWETFNRIIEDFSDVFFSYFDIVPLNTLSEKTVLDAGCGMGRWAFHVAPNAKRVIALDLSSAVEPAYRNCYERGNVEIVQADLLHPPLKAQFIDFAYCLGVLHHLPDPIAGFDAISRLLRRNGEILIYIYYNLDNRPIYFRWLKKSVDVLRQLTTRIPLRCSYLVAFYVAAFIYLPCIWLGEIFRYSGLSKKVNLVPLYEAYQGKSFRLVYNDAVDRLTAPVEKRYSKNAIREWFLKSGFASVRFSEEAPYWRALGTFFER